MSAVYSQTEVDEVARLLSSRAGHVHFVGVCGVGMAGVAFLVKQLGFRVTGCDLSAENRVASWLESHGIPVFAGHARSHAGPDVDWFVRSAAVPEESPEIAAARQAGKKVFRRGAVLPALLKGRQSIAIGGTHGKTTTTSFTTQVLKHAGKSPSFSIGGEVEALGGVAGAGTSDIIVVEGDESDGTLALYEPDIAVITNVEFDHMEYFADERGLKACFRRFMRNARRRVIFCADDPRASGICRGSPKALSYGLAEGADIAARDVEESHNGISYTLKRKGRNLGRISLPVRGRHNVLNSLAAAAVALEMGVALRQIRMALARVQLPLRRFEKVAEAGGCVVISDYAHHPSEIAALVKTARGLPHKRMLAVFQPHRYTRTLALGPEFPAAFEGVDQLVLAPVYAASEKPIAGGSTWDLYGHFRRSTGSTVLAGSSLRQIWEYYRRELREGDLFLVVGAGDVERIAEWARDALRATGLAGQIRSGSGAIRLGKSGS